MSPYDINVTVRPVFRKLLESEEHECLYENEDGTVAFKITTRETYPEALAEQEPILRRLKGQG